MRCYTVGVVAQVQHLQLRKEIIMFQIDLLSRTPVYEQITEQLRYFILTGIFNEGDQIPSVRSVSIEHSVNPRTVLKAYGDLDRQGLIQSVPGKGYFVSQDAKAKLSEAHLQKLTELTETVKEMALAGVPKEEVIKAIDKAYSETDKGGETV